MSMTKSRDIRYHMYDEYVIYVSMYDEYNLNRDGKSVYNSTDEYLVQNQKK